MSERLQGHMIGHGMLILCLGLLAGFPLATSLLEGAGHPERWRAAHTGNITNGLMLLAAAWCVSRLSLSPGALRFVGWGLIVSVWGNFVFYLGAALGASGRGLSFGPNRFGGGDLLSQITFLGPLPGALIAPAALLVLAWAAFKLSRSPA